MAQVIIPPKPHNFILGFEVQGSKVVFNSGYIRPASEQEKIIWGEYKRAKEDHTKACETTWEMYQAGTGTNMDTFQGIQSGSPIDDIRNERNNLVRALTRTRNYIMSNKDRPITAYLLKLLDPKEADVQITQEGN